jgi:hypothetical protein
MPDYSSLSDSDLISLKKGDYSSLSNDGLLFLKRQSSPSTSSEPAPIVEMRRREGEGEIAAAQPTPEQGLQQAVEQSKNIGYARAAAAAGGGGFMTSPEIPAEVAKQTGINIAATTARVAPVLAAGALTGGAGLVPAALAMGLAGYGGERTAQSIEHFSGQREQPDYGKEFSAGINAAIPSLRPIAGYAGPIGAGILQAGKQAIVNAASTVFGEVIEKAINQGEPLSWDDIKNQMSSNDFLKKVGVSSLFGGAVGGASGATARQSNRLLTEAEQIAQEGRAASGRLEQQLGVGTAPLTATQQTGRNLPGTFGPGSTGLATQQNLPEQIRVARGIDPTQERPLGQVFQQELSAADEVSRARLQAQAAGTVGEGTAAVERQIGTILPRSPRAASLQEAANASLGNIQAEEQRLSGIVDAAYNNVRSTLSARLGGRPEVPVTPSANLTNTINDILSTLATEQRIITTPSPIIGGAPSVTVQRIPSQFFNEASSRARALLDVANSPQTFEQLTGLRQSIDGLVHYFNEFAPGVAQNQLRRLRSALKQEELNSASRLGIENEVVAAQRLAENRFNLLQDNPIIRKATTAPRDGGYQNSEQFYDELKRSPEALESIQNLLVTTAVGRVQFNQIRRSVLDSLRGNESINIGGVINENLSSFSNGFRNLSQGVKNILAGDVARANQLQTVLDDAVRTQNAGMTIPVATGISNTQLSEIVDNLPNIQSRTLRATVENLSQQAVIRREQFFSNTTRRVLEHRLDPDTDHSQFVRDFLFRSENPQSVQNALNQLSPATRTAVEQDAATALLNHVSDTGPENIRRGIQSLDDIVRDPNRMQIIRETLNPDDFNMINDYMLWNRARNLTSEGGRLQPDQLANSVMRATRARWVVDSLVGNPAAQNFLSSVSRIPRVVALLKPDLTIDQAANLAKASNMSLIQLNRVWDDLYQKSESTKASLPEDKRAIFDHSLGVPPRPNF